MEDFNYENRKYLKLKKIDTEKVEEIYKDYEIITYSIEKDKLLMNGYKVAKIDKSEKIKDINDLKVNIDFDDESILSATYL